MSLNIKNPEAHTLAARLAKKTGETLTEAVVRSLRERLERPAEFDEERYRSLPIPRGSREGQPAALARFFAFRRPWRTAL
jgi:hypothetical protein